MKMSEIITLLAIVVTVIIGFWRFYSSSGWLPVQAEITHIDLVEIYNRPGTLKSENSRSFEYKIDVQYRYQYKGKSYVGDSIYPGLPNVFPYKEDAEKIVNDYPKGKMVEVYVDQYNPNNSGLMTSKQISKKGIIALGVFMLFALILIGGGLFYASIK